MSSFSFGKKANVSYHSFFFFEGMYYSFFLGRTRGPNMNVFFTTYRVFIYFIWYSDCSLVCIFVLQSTCSLSFAFRKKKEDPLVKIKNKRTSFPHIIVMQFQGGLRDKKYLARPLFCFLPKVPPFDRSKWNAPGFY